MYQKNHVGSLKETVVLRFTNGYQITLEAGVEMSMSLTMVEQSDQQTLAPDGARCLCGGEYYTDKVLGVVCCRCQAPRR